MQPPSKTPDVPAKLLVSEDVAAQALGLSTAFLRKDRRTAQRIPHIRLGTRVLYNLASVSAAMAALEVGGRQVAPRRRKVAA